MKIAASAFISICALLTACKPPVAPPSLPAQSRKESSPAAAMDAVLRRSIPSYVGLSLGPKGEIRVTVSDREQIKSAEALATAAWAGGMRERGAARGQDFVFVLAPLSAQELAQARAAMRDVLTLAKVVFLDLDEVCGCIAVGVSDAAAEASVLAFATQRGLRTGAVRTVLTPPIVRLLDLHSRYRPAIGGVEIRSPNGTCSLGLPVFHFGQQSSGLLTASHCTINQGGADATMFTQQDTPAPGTITVGTPAPVNNDIAAETVDPALFNQVTDSACPTGRRCRYSDVAFATYLDGKFGRIGRIIRPSSTCRSPATTCGLDVARTTDDIRVTAVSTGAAIGDVVDKIGRTTGWTSGAVSSTCVDANVTKSDGTDSSITMLCQYLVVAGAAAGDSGSPVFTFKHSTGTARIEGILWGSSGGVFAYSPISGIDREFGIIVYQQQGVAPPFFSNGRFYTSDQSDDLAFELESNAVPADQIEVVLIGGDRIGARKQIVLAEGTNPPADGTGRWTIAVGRKGDIDRNGLYLYQLAGGRLEFRKDDGRSWVEVARIPVDSIAPGTRLTFTWVDD